MGVMGTEMHWVTSLITLFELTFFFYQVIYYLSRPQDKSRLYYLILLYLLIQFNLIGGLLPDPDIPISMILQNIMAFGVALVMGMYFPYYFYKAYDLKALRFYAFGGSLVFLVVPFLAFFLVPYLITQDLELCRKIVVVVPFMYGLSFLFHLNRAIKEKNEEEYPIPKQEIIGMFVGVTFWCSLPLIAFFETDLNSWLAPKMNFNNGSQVVEVVATNCGLLVMTILFIMRTVRQSRDEYRLLQELNEDLTEKIRERTAQLEQLNEQRTTSFINLAHETKTPLMLIKSYLSDYVEKNGDSRELQVIRNNVNRLTNYIVNFFDIERADKGIEIYQHTQVTDFGVLLKESLSLFEVSFHKSHKRLYYEIGNDLFILADSHALLRIINNLIDNALKYTATNGNVWVKACQEGEEILFSVKDDGVGIDPELHDKIFEPYFQIRSQKRNNQGMGMGLPIVKKIADGLQANIAVLSDPHKYLGTEISLRFQKTSKLQGVLEGGILGSENEVWYYDDVDEVLDEVSDEEKPCILIVEDNNAMLSYMVSQMKAFYNIYVANGGETAWGKLQTLQHLDLIVSDVMMDQGDGISLLKEISNSKRFRHIPFIFITAKNVWEDRMDALNLGAVDYIQKPFHINELVVKINSVLHNLKEQRNALLQAAYKMMMQPQPIKGDPIDALDTPSLRERCRIFKLTDREVEIIRWISEGQSNKQIAEELFISDKTVAKHIQNIFEKVGVNNRVELLNKL